MAKLLTAFEYPLPALPSDELLNLLSLLDAGGDHAEPLSEGISSHPLSHIITRRYTSTTLITSLQARSIFVSHLPEEQEKKTHEKGEHDILQC